MLYIFFLITEGIFISQGFGVVSIFTSSVYVRVFILFCSVPGYAKIFC